MKLTFVIGGARSGKSRHAMQLARALSDNPVYLATSRIWDEDHGRRIERHRKDRGPEWRTVEEPKYLSQVGVQDAVVVIDCVTLWLTNFFIDVGHDLDRCLEQAWAEFSKLDTCRNHYIVVSNELGQGLHAETEIGRKFTDLQGMINQRIAARADDVTWMVAGIPVSIKHTAPSSRTE
ncbi:MAG TPA: bifunctional adenosylcobinamide kinase/adenosylcobinamide-phosphate guanylyltransferase [Polyangiaceae bacterium]|nr:bifunctional adenosylcobinamide kinase/adenosylcobinamide-phosphate guanylyltransferase [Polyangiaceae bacterium]